MRTSGKVMELWVCCGYIYISRYVQVKGFFCLSRYSIGYDYTVCIVSGRVMYSSSYLLCVFFFFFWYRLFYTVSVYLGSGGLDKCCLDIGSVELSSVLAFVVEAVWG